MIKKIFLMGKNAVDAKQSLEKCYGKFALLNFVW